MGSFSGVGKATKFNQGGVFFEPGNYVIRVEKVKAFESRNEEECFCVDDRSGVRQ